MRALSNGVAAALLAAAMAASAPDAAASDHLDTQRLIEDPRADIGDVYAWMSPDGRRLNLVMAIVGRSFSDELRYEFHIDSGRSFGRTRASVTLACRFAHETATDCRLGHIDRVRGDTRIEAGLEGQRRLMRVFTGLRNDPFFNNVRGTRAAYNVAAAAIAAGASADSAGCTALAPPVSDELMRTWGQTDGGPGRDFLASFTPMAIVASIDVRAVSRGGPLIAVWGAVTRNGEQIDRAARPLTGNALLGTLASRETSDAMKEEWNGETPRRSARFAPLIAEGLALYDGFNGSCGDQWLADASSADIRRYSALSTLLADDRIWINSEARSCQTLFAVERAALSGETALGGDCGGRAPSYDSVNIYRSLLVDGSSDSIDDGVHRDDHSHSDSVFPFLAPADSGAVLSGEPAR
jgi:hypothetical protein